MSERRFRLRPTNTFAAILVRNDESKLLSRLGHHHVVRADEFTSTLSIDPNDPSSLRFALSFPVFALVVDNPDDRRRVDLDPQVSSKDRATTRENMLASSQLDAQSYGNIDFRVDGASVDPQGRWILNAALIVKLHRHDFSFPVHLQWEPQLRVQGRVDITHDDLNLKPYRAPMGTLQNDPRMSLIVDIDAAPL